MTGFYFKQVGNIIEVRFSTDTSVNAWTGRVFLSAPPGNLRIMSADSIAAIWQTTPQWNGQSISFTGGTPNGFTGDGVLFSFLPPPGSYGLSFASGTAVYLNDGLGTAVTPTLNQLAAQISAATSTLDNVPPEPFTPTLYQNKSFFDGKLVAIFSTADLQSGINHYEIKEITDRGVSNWHLAQSPYLVQNDVQTLEIKAVDNFGNSRIETLNIRPGALNLWLLGAILAVVVLGTLILYNKKRWRRRTT